MSLRPDRAGGERAVEELEERLAQGHDDAIVGVVDENTRGVVFAVHKDNVGNFK